EKSGLKETSVRVNCDVYYTRAQCGIHLDSPNSENAEAALTFLAKELVTLRDKGLTQQAFDALIARKSDELSKLFATYARTSTDVLMQQRMGSQRNGVVDIAPEQYQKLRQAYLSELTLPLLNQELHQQLSQDTTLMLKQQKGEAEVNTKALYEAYSKIMTPPVAVEAASAAPSEGATQTKPAQ
ncbi:insulinase family protein, partial [Candidatus Symbiopectobacterium sp. NZEC135]|nr:insulinase family protein [Candidatus Symbiopectobacterium sp. NZEC135]